jgi:hypothetical protein
MSKQRTAKKFTWRETHEESSTGSSWMTFLERSTFITSPDSHTSDGTALKPSPSKESS